MNILIVDDEKNIRLALANVLRDEGYTIVEAETGEAALNQLPGGPVDLVLLDVKLPGIDGLSVLAQIKTHYPDLDVVMISGNSDIQTAVEAVKRGAYDFMEKPLSLPKILVTVKNIAERRRLLHTYQAAAANWGLSQQLVGESPQIQAVRQLILRVAATDSKVLITGESGTGKELVAFAIHQNSRRRAAPFVKFNSAAIPRELVESELFGSEKGAFTGADKRTQGKLEMAHQGTLFLDEIGDMHSEAQAKILRVIEEGRFERVGGRTTIAIDVRILAATNRPLEEMIRAGTFREDLFYRLNVVPVRLPPLRERTGDIAILLGHYTRFFARELNQPLKHFDPAAIAMLQGYPFPGNVRELKNLVERLCILVSGAAIRPEDVAPHVGIAATGHALVSGAIHEASFAVARKQFEKQYLEQQLDRFGWNISRTAQAIGMQQPNLSRKIHELDIEIPAES